MFFKNSQRSQQIFGLLQNENLPSRFFKNRPIWSHWTSLMFSYVALYLIGPFELCHVNMQARTSWMNGNKRASSALYSCYDSSDIIALTTSELHIAIRQLLTSFQITLFYVKLNRKIKIKMHELSCSETYRFKW